MKCLLKTGKKADTFGLFTIPFVKQGSPGRKNEKTLLILSYYITWNIRTGAKYSTIAIPHPQNSFKTCAEHI